MRKPFDLMDQMGRFAADRKLSLTAPEAKDVFAEHVRQSTGMGLADQALLHGQRTEAMFEALLVSLGRFKLLTPEDGGRVFPEGEFLAPDFRVVLADGRQWLIEVKNVYEADAFGQRRSLMNRAYHDKLAAYASATRGELKLAVFWARWSVWTLVSPERLMNADGDLELDMAKAMTVDELGALGDMTIGTRAPFRFRLAADPARTKPIGPDGETTVVFSASQLFSEDREITDPVELEIAWTLIQHGEWVEQEPTPIVDGDNLLAMEFSWAPREDDEGKGFGFIGRLSRIFARYYAAHTLEEGSVIQLRAPLRPNWFTPLHEHDHQSKALPLWRFTLQPNYGGATDAPPPPGEID
ncbi:hypothetical protein [Sphingomonas abietis]|uniref:Restriction endonuclease n=1 Tax=Sphingomonas abietis TaxID=3012344 RepID=A0ABY7NRM4_9SPHN|nr:hypothetical protein [Sphingomonas abietis]WBO23212.1 hypothetical protein PBT88_03485 [Sphingomonas abietis]